MSSSFDCRKCGASLPLPTELSVIVVRCQYCATDQAVPELEARQRALSSQGSPVAARGPEVDIGRVLRWMILPPALMGVTALVLVFFNPSTRPAPGGLTSAGGWDGARTFECKDKQIISLSDVHASTRGVAIRAEGHCNVTITRSSIKADTAIVASGRALVSIFDVDIDAPITVDVSEHAQVFVYKGRTNGRVVSSGDAIVTVH